MTAVSRDAVRWAVLGTAGIARRTFLPSLAAAGQGIPLLVAGRDLAAAERFAADTGVQRAVAGYARALADPEVDAVYVPLPNSLHAEWTAAALAAGKTVLCEKPLCGSAAETQLVLETARDSGRLLWEAIAFLFRAQTDRLLTLVHDGAIGAVQEIQSTFHSPVEPGDIRLDPGLGGGALADVGCYPIRLARLLFGAEAAGVQASQRLTDDGVDLETSGVVDFPDHRRLLFSVSFTKAYTTTTRVIGTSGEIRLSRAFAGTSVDTIEIHRPGDDVLVEHAAGGDPQFRGLLEHIHDVVRGDDSPRHLAVDEAAGNAMTIDAIRRSSRAR